MQALVGIIRTEDELKKALDRLGELKERAGRATAEGNRLYNPGWHLALDLQSLLAVSETIALAALERKESRGAQTREDYPQTDPEFAKVNIVVRMKTANPTWTGHRSNRYPTNCARSSRGSDGRHLHSDDADLAWRRGRGRL